MTSQWPFIMTSQCIMALLWTFSICILCFMHNCVILLWVRWNKKQKQKQIHVWSEHILCFLCRAYTSPSDSWNIPSQTQLMCSPQTDQTLNCSCYNNIALHVVIFVYINQVGQSNTRAKHTWTLISATYFP